MPWSRVLLEKLTGPQLVKKLTAFYGNWRFVTAFTVTCHLSLSWANSIQSISPLPLNSATHFLTNGSTLETGHFPQVQKAGKLLNIYGLIVTVFVTIILENPALWNAAAYLYVPYDSADKQQLFPYAAFTDWFFCLIQAVFCERQDMKFYTGPWLGLTLSSKGFKTHCFPI